MRDLERDQYEERMDELMRRIDAVLGCDVSAFDVAGIGLVLLMTAIARMSPEGQAKAKGWMREYLAKDRLH